MKNINLVLIMCAFLISNACDKPDVLKKEAYLEVENNSTMYDITGVYYSNLGYGSNRLKSNIKPGESKTFELSAEDDYIYNIMVTSSNTSIGDYTADDIHFYDDRRITVELYDDEWDDYYPW